MIDQVLFAIAEPRRREILALVRDRELSSGEVASHFDVTGPAISQHLRILVAAGLLTLRKDGTRRLYRASPDGILPLQSFVAGFFGSGLEEIKRGAEAIEAEMRADER